MSDMLTERALAALGRLERDASRWRCFRVREGVIETDFGSIKAVTAWREVVDEPADGHQRLVAAMDRIIDAARRVEPSSTAATPEEMRARESIPESQGGEQSHSSEGRSRIERLEWAIVRTLYAGDIEPPNPAAPFWFREQLLRDAGLTMERCRELMDLHRGEDRVARL